MRLLALITVPALCIVACSPGWPGQKADADKTFFDVLAHPDMYDGKRVTVTAWISLRDEDRNLWASWADHEKWETRRCISLSHYDQVFESRSTLDGRYVRVTGVIRSDASRGGRVLRLASCRNAAVELADASSVDVVRPRHESGGKAMNDD